jgi:Leucine-rich repeat (LRR) protein
MFHNVFEMCENDSQKKQQIVLGDNIKIDSITERLSKGCENLERIFINNNQISALPESLFSECKQLRTISFNNNQISALPEKLFNECKQLRTISFDNNQISALPKGIFKECWYLEWISFDNNQISTITRDIFYWGMRVKRISFNNNQIFTLAETIFEGCWDLLTISFNNNQISTLKSEFFYGCEKLHTMEFNNNQISALPEDLFYRCHGVQKISFNNNQISALPEDLFYGCEKLHTMEFNNNQISALPEDLFYRCHGVQKISFNNNQISALPENLFDGCRDLREIYFNNNQISSLPENLFDGCSELLEIYFNNNQISALPENLFDGCRDLREISFNNNQISALPENLFDGCRDLREIYFNNNQILEIPEKIFHECIDLLFINFASNQIKELNHDYFRGCTEVISLNLEKNNIQTISFRALEPLSKITDINLTNNYLQNSKSIYSSLFQHKSYSELHYSNLSKTYFCKNLKQTTQYIIIRQSDSAVVEKYFLAFYLSSSSKTHESIRSLKSNFDRFNRKDTEDSNLTEFSLLDLFISVFGEIDDSKITNLAKHIDLMLSRDKNLQNLEFLIRSEKSFRKLCERNIFRHFETFFPNTFQELILQVRKPNIKTEDFKSSEEETFKLFCKNIAIKKNVNEIIFHHIGYTECFNIALENKNTEIAKFIIILLRFYCKVWSEFENVDWVKEKDITESDRDRCSRRAHDVLNKFNQNLLLKLEDIFKNDLKEIVIFLLDIEKYDRLNCEKKVAAKKEKEKEKTGNKGKDKKETSFLEYDFDRYNSKQTDPARRIVVEGAKKKKEFLQFAKENDELLKHESVHHILNEKWHEKAAIEYYCYLFFFVIFVLFYTVYIELEGKDGLYPIWQLCAKYISLIIAVYNLIDEAVQCLLHTWYQKFIKYITRYVIQYLRCEIFSKQNKHKGNQSNCFDLQACELENVFRQK